MIDSVKKTTAAAAATSTQPAENTTEATSISKEFDELMRSFLPGDAAGQVSEEELFAANCGEKISALKGSEALEKNKTVLAEQRQALARPDGFVPEEEAAIAVLRSLVADGTLTESEGDTVYTRAFNASQLDDDSASLFDSRGGANDPTTAMALLSEAIQKASDASGAVADLEEGSLMSLASASATGAGASAKSTGALLSAFGDGEVIEPNGTYVDGSKGFLFKPVTNNEGTLAVLGAVEWTGNIQSVMIKDSLNNVLEEGKQQLWGVSETGQEKWVFSKPGGSYPNDISVEIRMLDGSVRTYQIADPSQRYD